MFGYFCLNPSDKFLFQGKDRDHTLLSEFERTVHYLPVQVCGFLILPNDKVNNIRLSKIVF